MADYMNSVIYTSPRIADHHLGDIDNLCRLDNGRHHPHPDCSIGALEQLPLELLNIVLTQLDIRSLTDFRRVNQRAMQVVDSIPQYKAIAVHAPAALQGILSIDTGGWISCQDLYEKLCAEKCDICGDFGPYLYLITCRRVCFLCFIGTKDYLPLRPTDVLRKFGLNREHLARLPAMKTVPGWYSILYNKLASRVTLFDPSAAQQVGLAVHGSISKMEQYASQVISKKLQLYQSRKSQQMAGTREATVRRPRTEDEPDGTMTNPKRFMAIVRAPFLNPRTRSSQQGFHCVACRRYHYDRPLHWRREFTEESFKCHIRECGNIIAGEHV